LRSKSITIVFFILLCAFAARSQGNFPPETTNAALRYWLAFAEMRDPPADKLTQDLLEKTVAGKVPWDEKALGPILDANGDAIRMMQRATKLPKCDWGLEYAEGPRASIAYAPRARVLSRLNTLQGMREMANGNSEAAVGTWLAGIRFSEHMANGGSLIFALIAKSTLLPNLQALTAAATQGSLTNSQKEEIFAQLRRIPEDGFNWAAAWGFEELAGERTLQVIRDSEDPGATYELLMGSAHAGQIKAPTSENIEKYRVYMRAVQAALGAPPERTTAQISALESQRLTLTVVAQQIIPNAQKENDARLEVLAARKKLLEALGAKS
jgi:hypothetical protein